MRYPGWVRTDVAIAYESGLSSYDIEREFGIPQTTISRWCREGQITRSNSEARFLAANGIMMPTTLIPARELEILHGMLLGDVCLRKLRRGGDGNAMFRWNGKYKRTGETIRAALPSLEMAAPNSVIYKDGRPGKKTEYQGWALRSRCDLRLTEQYEKWYPEGKKIVPHSIRLTPAVCYWWYVGDGNLSKSNGQMRLHTNGFLRQDVEYLTNLLQELGLHPVIREYNHGPFIEMPRRDQQVWFSYIGQCRNPEYSYKWLEESNEP